MSRLEALIKEYCPNGVVYDELGNLGKFYGGLSGKTKEDFSNGNSKFITYMNVFANPSLIINTEEKVFISENEKQNTILYGDIIFTGSSENKEECGMSSILTERTDEKLYLNSFCFGFRFNNHNLLLPEFSKHLFRSQELRKQINKTASGVTRFNVSKKKMEKVSIPLPPVAVQAEIVRILDNFTDLTADLTAELTARKEQYEYYKESLLSFGGDVETFPLRCYVDFLNGKGHEKSIIENGKYIVVNSKFVSSDGNVQKYSEKQIVPIFKDDILMVMSDLPNGRALSKCFIVDENNKYTLNQRICALTVKSKKEVLPKFLFYFLTRNRQLLKYDNGVDQTNLKKDQILDMQVPKISYEYQQRIVDILDRFDTLCNDISIGLPSEIKAREEQYEYYRNKLLTFKEKEV